MANNGVNTQKKEEKRNIAQNKKAYHEYFIEETIECGIELFGTEVKSLREGRVNLKDSYCNIVKGEVFAETKAKLLRSKNSQLYYRRCSAVLSDIFSPFCMGHCIDTTITVYQKCFDVSIDWAKIR